MEEQEMNSLNEQPTGLNPITEKLLASHILNDVEKYKSKPLTDNLIPANAKIASARDLIKAKPEFPSINEIFGEEKEVEPKDPVEVEKAASQKRIDDFVNESRKSGTQAAQSKLAETKTDVISYDEVEKFAKSGDFEKLGYTRGADNESKYDAEQSWYGDIGRNLLGTGANTIGSFAGTISSLPTLLNQIGKYAIGTNDVLDKDGNRSVAKAIEGGYDNAVSRGINDFQKYVNEDLAYNFRNERERDLESNSHWYNPLLNLVPIYGNGMGESVRSLGFTAGALGALVLEEWVTAGLGSAGVLAQGVGYIPRLAGKIAGAVKSTERIDKMIDGMKSLGIISKVDNAVDIGNAVKKAYTGYDIGLGLKIGVRPIVRGVVGAMSEASMEALETKENMFNTLVEEYRSKNNGKPPEGEALAEINDTVTNAANARYLANIAIIGANNSIMLNSLFKNMPMTKKLIGEEAQAASRIALDKEAGKFVEKGLEKSVSKWATDPKWYKALTGKSYDAVRNANIGKFFAVSEGAEEGLQNVARLATDSYYTRQYHTDDKDFNMYEAYLSTARALKDTVTTTEGWNGILQGMLGGGMSTAIGVGINKYKEGTPEYKEQQARIKEYNIQQADSMNEKFADILNMNSIGGSLVNKVYDIKTKKAIQKEMIDAASNDDNYRFQNNKHDLKFNFVNSFLANNQGEVLMEHIADLRDLAMNDPKKFNETFGREEEGITASNPVDAIDELKSLAENAIKDKQKLDLLFVNPYANPKTTEDRVGYAIFEKYKSELLYQKSKVNDYKKRIGDLEGEMDGHGSVLNQLLDNETYDQELKLIQEEYNLYNNVKDEKNAKRLLIQHDFITKMKEGKATPEEIVKYASNATNIGFLDEVDNLIQKQMDIILLKRNTKRAFELYNKLAQGNGFKKFIKDNKEYQDTIIQIKEEEEANRLIKEQADKNKIVSEKSQILEDKVKEALKKHGIDIKDFSKKHSIKYKNEFFNANYDITRPDSDIQAWVDARVAQDVIDEEALKEKKAVVNETVSKIVDVVAEEVKPEIKATETKLSEADQFIQDALGLSGDTSGFIIDEDAQDDSTNIDDLLNRNHDAVTEAFIDTEPQQVEEEPIPVASDNVLTTPKTAEEFLQDIFDKVEEQVNVETIDEMTPEKIQEVIEKVVEEIKNPTQSKDDFDKDVHVNWKNKLILSPYGSGKSELAKKSNIFIDGDALVSNALRERLIADQKIQSDEELELIDNPNVNVLERTKAYGIPLNELKDAVTRNMRTTLENGQSVMIGSTFYINDAFVEEMKVFDNLIAVKADKDRVSKLKEDIADREFNNDIPSDKLNEKVDAINDLDVRHKVDLITTPQKTYYLEDVVKFPIAVVKEKFVEAKAKEVQIEATVKEERVPVQVNRHPFFSLLFDSNSFAFIPENKIKYNNLSILVDGVTKMTAEDEIAFREIVKQNRIELMEAIANGDTSAFAIENILGTDNVKQSKRIDGHKQLYRKFNKGYIGIVKKGLITLPSGARVKPVLFFLPQDPNIFVDFSGNTISYSNTKLFGDNPLSKEEYNKIDESKSLSYDDYRRMNDEYMEFLRYIKEEVFSQMRSGNPKTLDNFIERTNLKLQLTDANTVKTEDGIPLSSIIVSNAVNTSSSNSSKIAIVKMINGKIELEDNTTLTKKEKESLIARLNNHSSDWDFGNSWWMVNFNTISGVPIFNKVSGKDESQMVVDLINSEGRLPSLSEKLSLLFNLRGTELIKNFRFKIGTGFDSKGNLKNYIRVEFSKKAYVNEADSNVLNIEVPISVPRDATSADIGGKLIDMMLNDTTTAMTYKYTSDGQTRDVTLREFFKDVLMKRNPSQDEESIEDDIDELFNVLTSAQSNHVSISKVNVDNMFIENSTVNTGTPNVFDKVYFSTSFNPESKPNENIPVAIEKPVELPAKIEPVAQTIIPQIEAPVNQLSENELAKIINDAHLKNIQSLDLTPTELDSLQSVMLDNPSGKSLEEQAKLFDIMINDITLSNPNGTQFIAKLDKKALFKWDRYSNFGKLLASNGAFGTKIKTLQNGGLYTSIEIPFTRLSESVENELEQLKKRCF